VYETKRKGKSQGKSGIAMAPAETEPAEPAESARPR
jgi:hypothetical protein